MVRLLRVAFVLTLLVPACAGGSGGCDPPPPKVVFDAGGSRVVLALVGVARTEQARARGLMGRTSLGSDQGMLFSFDEPTETRFWMKDTKIPLSIAFWGRDGRIVDVIDMRPCTADPCPTYGPSRSYVAAVEANLGYFDRHGIGAGDEARFRPTYGCE